MNGVMSYVMKINIIAGPGLSAEVSEERKNVEHMMRSEQSMI